MQSSKAASDIKNYDDTQSAYIISAAANHGNGNRIVGATPVMMELFRKIDVLATIDAPVLITGESGTGKDMVAKALHHNGSRKMYHLSTVHCAAIPSTLIESTLFGVRKGAYTDAKRDTEGEFLNANGGTIFLDEISEMPIETQSKLLRILQDGVVKKVGDTKVHSIDVRIIAATNKDLEKEAAAGRFREDLYYRLNVVPLVMPSLAARLDDIELLAKAFIDKHNLAARKESRIDGIAPDAVDKLRGYDKKWPGNVRQLDNIMARAMISAGGGTIEAKDITFTDAEFQRISIRPRPDATAGVLLLRSKEQPPALAPAPQQNATAKGNRWYQQEGGIIPIVTYELHETPNTLPTPSIEALIREGKIYYFPIYKPLPLYRKFRRRSSYSAGVLYLTPESLPLIFNTTIRNSYYDGYLKRLREGEFARIAEAPFLITTGTALRYHPATYERPTGIINSAREHLDEDHVIFDFSHRFIFVVTEENARFFVPKPDSERGALRVEALKNTIRMYYEAFRRREPVQDLVTMFSGSRKMPS